MGPREHELLCQDLLELQHLCNVLLCDHESITLHMLSQQGLGLSLLRHESLLLARVRWQGHEEKPRARPHID